MDLHSNPNLNIKRSIDEEEKIGSEGHPLSPQRIIYRETSTEMHTKVGRHKKNIAISIKKSQNGNLLRSLSNELSNEPQTTKVEDGERIRLNSINSP